MSLRPRRLALLSSGILVSAVLLLSGVSGVGADDAGTATMLLNRSRQAVTGNEFRGTMVVEWREGRRLRERRVSVRVADGVVHLGDNRIVSSGTRRLLKTDAGWRLLWSDAAKERAPDPSRKYRFTVENATSVAGRQTEVAIVRTGDGDVRERLYFDQATGLLLRRDQLDANGRVVRRVAFAKISSPQPTDKGNKDSLPALSGRTERRGPWALRDVPDDLSAPRRIGNGFVLLGLYGQPGGSTHLYYSDGLFGLSIFAEAGELAWDELPDGGSAIELEGTRARVYQTAAGSAVVWEHDDVTYTCVTDAPLDDVRRVTADLARWDEEPSTLEDIGRFVTGPFSWG